MNDVKRSLAYMLWYLFGMSEEVKYDFDMGHRSEAHTEIPPRFWRASEALMMNYKIGTLP